MSVSELFMIFIQTITIMFGILAGIGLIFIVSVIFARVFAYFEDRRKQ